MEGPKNNSPGLKKEINLLEATLLVVGVVIGSGVFFKPSSVFKNAGAPGLGILAWVVGCIITIAGALSIAELGSAIPETGGLIVYLKKLYGEKMSFLFGWVQVLIYYPGLDAALAVVFATQCTSFMDITPVGQKILALALLLVLGIINLISTKVGTKFASIAAIAKLIPIAVIIAAGLAMGKVHAFTPMASSASTGVGFGAAVLGVLFAYEGWIAVTNMAGELKNPVKDLPKAIVIGLTIVTIVYLGVNLAVINTMPVAAVAASKKAVADASVILFGPTGAGLISIGIIISIVGCLSPFIMTGARLPFAMAKDKLFVAEDFFSKLNKNGTPANAMIFQLALACIYTLTGSFDTLTNLVVFVNWIFIMLGIGGVFLLRKNHKELIKEDSYKVPLYPVIPIIGIIGALYVGVSTLITSTSFALYGLGVTIIGLPVYMLLRKRNENRNISM
ncbi:amino acid permease [Clostridium sp. JN-1]|uniref:APC family permease n=1 Tax=Clostridium sp. JN-1 TaxID=2483110 RepID=UPI000F0B7BA0|nr:amino acid permease [Clostridium sp. JN-1]